MLDLKREKKGPVCPSIMANVSQKPDKICSVGVKSQLYTIPSVSMTRYG